MDAAQARLALAVFAGFLRDDPAAEDIALDAFDSLDDAAMSYAYLCGYLVVTLADALQVTAVEALDQVRAAIQKDLGP